MARWIIWGGSAGALLLGAACGAATVPAAAPPEEPVAPSVAPPPVDSGAAGAGGAASGELGPGGAAPIEAAADDTTAAVASASSEEPPAPPPPPPMPREVLVADGIAFLLDDPSSGLKDALTERCRKKIADDDPAKVAACRTEARDEFGADVLVFKRQPDGSLRWTVYQRSRSVLKEVHTARVELLDETPTRFTLRSRGGQGVRPIYEGRGDVPVRMPSKHELVIDDPKYGQLIYRAKMGLVGR